MFHEFPTTSTLTKIIDWGNMFTFTKYMIILISCFAKMTKELRVDVME